MRIKTRFLAFLAAIMLCIPLMPASVTAFAYSYSSADYVPEPKVEVLSVNTNTYQDEYEVSKSLKVRFSCSDSNAEIHYVINGKDYVIKNEKSIYIKKNATIDVYAKKGDNISYSRSYTFELTPAVTPSVEEGWITKKTTIKYTTAVKGAKLYYTTDGTTPTKKSPAVPQKGITVSKSTVVKILAVKSGWNSKVYTYNYYMVPKTLKVSATNCKTKYCYTMLNSQEKKAYKELSEYLYKYKDGTISGYKFTYDEINHIETAMSTDHPYLYLSVSGQDEIEEDDERYYTSTKITLSTDTAKYMAAIKKKTDSIVKTALKETDIRKRAKVLYDWLMKNTYYSYEGFSAYDAIVNGASVCEGYARAYAYLCQSAGIPATVVSGTGHGGAHMWTMVWIDGKWLHADATWDDQPSVTYEYFLKDDEFFQRDHLAQENSKYVISPSHMKVNWEKLNSEFDKLVEAIYANYQKGIYTTAYYLSDVTLMGAMLEKYAYDLRSRLYEKGIYMDPWYSYWNEKISIQLRN